MSTKRKFNVGDKVKVKKTGRIGTIYRYETPYYTVKFDDCYSDYTASQLMKSVAENIECETFKVTNFKLGDRVKTIRSRCFFDEGATGTIVAANNFGSYGVKFDEKPGFGHNCEYPIGGYKFVDKEALTGSMCLWVGECDIAILETKPSKFKLGDRVVCISDTAYAFKKGETATVIGKYKDYDERYLFKHDIPNNDCHDGLDEEYEWGGHSENNDSTSSYGRHFQLLSKESKEEIHITRKGNEVHAIYKKDGKLVKRSVAKCCPEDTFDFKIGAELALSRLYNNNDIKENKLYNGYVLCVDNCNNPGLYTKGKIYKFENGKLESDTGVLMSGCFGKPCRSFEDWKQFTASKFKEIKVDAKPAYKMGDKVYIKTWEQLVKEFGGESLVYVKTEPTFVTSMKKHCGSIITIGRVYNDCVYADGWYFDNDCILGKVVD